MAHARRVSGTAFVVLVLLLIPSFVSSRPTSAAEARAAYLRWIAPTGDTTRLRAVLGARLAARIDRTRAVADADGVMLYYFLELSPDGFAVLAADDQIGPVICFSPHGRLNPADMRNPLAALLKSDLAQRYRLMQTLAVAKVRRAVPHSLSPLVRRTERSTSAWTRLTAPLTVGAYIDFVSDPRVAPLLETHWDQGCDANGNACFNYYTPRGPDGSADNYPCGCVATAISQVMRYFKYPNDMRSTETFSVIVDRTTTRYERLLGGDGHGGPYAWDKMPPVADGHITLAQRQAIGRLTHDAGASVNMSYTPEGSWANASILPASALTNQFHYSNASVINRRSETSTTLFALTNVINPNLDNRRPVILGIFSGFNFWDGHEVVCDGYGYDAGVLYHHINFGWSGGSDTWYDLQIDINIAGYNVVGLCICNIYTTGSGQLVSGRVTDDKKRALSGIPVTVTTSIFLGATTTTTLQTDIHGIYSSRVPASTTTTISVAGQRRNFMVFPPSDSYSGNVWGLNFIVRKLRAVDWTKY